MQAYQKRAPEVIARLAELSRTSGRRLMVRLVKGAYWDTEIKRAQVAGRPDYPVFTTKAATDLCYLACARALIEAAPVLYPQFATHNAHTLAAVHALAADRGVRIEVQRLHGMGEALYEAAAEQFGAQVLRVYAPVGEHEDLLPYLVRRLLENGANTSFARALTDEHAPPSIVAADPIAAVEAHPARHSRIPKPIDLYGPDRKNSAGIDLSQATARTELASALEGVDAEALAAGLGADGAGEPVRSPTDGHVVGRVWEAAASELEAAVAGARAAQSAWDAAGGVARARVLRRVADAIEADRERLIAILAREGGKTLADGDRRGARGGRLLPLLRAPGRAGLRRAGQRSTARSARPTGWSGTGAASSPPSARGTSRSPSSLGQIAAALAAGNAVVAKPAEQTPLIAAAAVRYLSWRRARSAPSGADCPGGGESVGAALIAHPGVDGVAFTGGTDTARAISRGAGQAATGRSCPSSPRPAA